MTIYSVTLLRLKMFLILKVSIHVANIRAINIYLRRTCQNRLCYLWRTRIYEYALNTAYYKYLNKEIIAEKYKNSLDKLNKFAK